MVLKIKSAAIRTALDCLQRKLEKEKLELSAELYAEIYLEDHEPREITEAAMTEWP